MYKQVIIVRKDLKMSPVKLAAQVSHASMAFLAKMVTSNTVKIYDNRFSCWYEKGDTRLYLSPQLNELVRIAVENGENCFYASKSDATGVYEPAEPKYHYETRFNVDAGIYEEWLKGDFAKVVLQAKNKNHLLKARTMANEFAMIEGKDFFLNYDYCNTKLSPDDKDRRILTAIGFRPMEEEMIDQIGRKYRIYT